MIELDRNLYVGNQHDLEVLPERGQWAIVHCAKEPWHREALGYTAHGAPKTHPEYLFAVRGNRLCLNLVDVDDPAYIQAALINAALAFIGTHLSAQRRTLVHCNQGGSRGPGVAMAYLAPALPERFDDAERVFIKMYPQCAMRFGIRGYLEANWRELRKE